MPIVQDNEYLTPYLVYDAPVNDKTKRIREMFNVDENTGYPVHYNWRPMARLGSEYSYTDPFEKLGEYNPDEYISTRVMMVTLVTVSCAGIHWWTNYMRGKKFYAGLHRFVGASALFIGALTWTSEKTLQRQAQRNHIMIDYVTKHPERFEKIYRPKFRETLYEYIPAR